MDPILTKWHPDIEKYVKMPENKNTSIYIHRPIFNTSIKVGTYRSKNS